ncbi:MAG: hypothetical protein MI865_01395, partial [Proteobacteria bacterium]|nr:hypothetical protein [Pseudomonadota bacterium]
LIGSSQSAEFEIGIPNHLEAILAFRAGTPLDGLELIDHTGIAGKLVLVEVNSMANHRNSDVIESVIQGPLDVLKRSFLMLREKTNP